MRIETRSKRLRRAIDCVLAKMPRTDREKIEAVCRHVSAEKYWQSSDMFAPVPDFNSAEFRRSQTGTERSSADLGRIVFYLPVVRYFSDRALIGIVAHEFGHARRAATYENVDAFMKVRTSDRYEEEEDLADAYARKWGLGANLRAMREERERVVGPALQQREDEIARQIEKRDERIYGSGGD